MDKAFHPEDTNIMIMNDAPPQISMSDITGYNCFGWTVQGLIFCQPDPTMQPKHNVEIWGRGKKNAC